MKILQIIQKQQLRGAEIFACQLSVELNNRGYTTDILYLFDSQTSLPNFNLRITSLHAHSKRRFWDIGAFRRLAKIIEAGKYDIVQANAGDTLKYAVFSQFIFQWSAKIVFRNASHMSDFMRGRVHRSFNRWLLSQCGYFISVSENTRQDLIDFYPKAANASVTIPIGTATFENVPAYAAKFSGQEPVFINVGSFVPEKNHLFMLEVFFLYFRQNGKGFLWLVGDGYLRPAIEEKIAYFGLGDRVKLWGYRSDVISIVKSADVLVMPSLIEGLPGVILEAISCEVPVVASAVGGIPEIIENDVTGICISEWATDAYVRAMTSLVSDPVLKSRLVRQAKVRLMERFTIARVAEEFLSEYQKLVNTQS